MFCSVKINDNAVCVTMTVPDLLVEFSTVLYTYFPLNDGFVALPYCFFRVSCKLLHLVQTHEISGAGSTPKGTLVEEAHSIYHGQSQGNCVRFAKPCLLFHWNIASMCACAALRIPTKLRTFLPAHEHRSSTRQFELCDKEPPAVISL